MFDHGKSKNRLAVYAVFIHEYQPVLGMFAQIDIGNTSAMAAAAEEDEDLLHK